MLGWVSRICRLSNSSSIHSKPTMVLEDLKVEEVAEEIGIRCSKGGIVNPTNNMDLTRITRLNCHSNNNSQVEEMYLLGSQQIVLMGETMLR